MVLCVSAIIDSPVNQLADGTNELTDGWYIIRANIDAPICRALKKGKLRLGYKIAISGAKVCMQGMNAQ
jgi:breast cancer 2 susceptibility protein